MNNIVNVKKSYSPNSIFQSDNSLQKDKVDFRPCKLAPKSKRAIL